MLTEIVDGKRYVTENGFEGVAKSATFNGLPAPLLFYTEEDGWIRWRSHARPAGIPSNWDKHPIPGTYVLSETSGMGIQPFIRCLDDVPESIQLELF